MKAFSAKNIGYFEAVTTPDFTYQSFGQKPQTRKAALDGLKIVSEALPADLTLSSLVLQQGKTLTLRGSAPIGQTPKVTEYNSALGKVLLNGQDISGATQKALLAQGIAFVPQGRNLFGQLSVYENLELGGITLGMKTTHERIPEVLEFFPRVKERLNTLLTDALKDVAQNDRIILDTGDGTGRHAGRANRKKKN